MIIYSTYDQISPHFRLDTCISIIKLIIIRFLFFILVMLKYMNRLYVFNSKTLCLIQWILFACFWEATAVLRFILCSYSRIIPGRAQGDHRIFWWLNLFSCMQLKQFTCCTISIDQLVVSFWSCALIGIYKIPLSIIHSQNLNITRLRFKPVFFFECCLFIFISLCIF